jgi:tetratricopeptide (TPR) repeat protein
MIKIFFAIFLLSSFCMPAGLYVGSSDQKLSANETFQKGLEFSKQEKYRQAIEYFKKSADEGFDTTRAYFQIGVCYIRLSEEENARNVLEYTRKICDNDDFKKRITYLIDNLPGIIARQQQKEKPEEKQKSAEEKRYKPVVDSQSTGSIKLAKKTGEVFYFNKASEKWEDLHEKSRVQPAIYIKTGRDSQAVFSFGKKAVVTLTENTVVCLSETTFRGEDIENVKIKTAGGKIWSAVEKLPADSEFEIETPNALAGIRGTVFMVDLKTGEETTTVGVVDGEVRVSSKAAEGYVILKENMMTTVVANKPPVSPKALEEKEKREWEKWQQSIPFSEIGIIGGIAETHAIMSQEASRIVRELGIAKKGTKKVLEDFKNIESAIILYYSDTEKAPEKLANLMTDPQVKGWNGPYLGAGTTFKDPYGRPYQYRLKKSPAGKDYIELYTFGLVGATGDTYGAEKKIIFIDKLREKAEEKLQQIQK